jgi:hypothetical protein
MNHRERLKSVTCSLRSRSTSVPDSTLTARRFVFHRHDSEIQICSRYSVVSYPTKKLNISGNFRLSDTSVENQSLFVCHDITHCTLSKNTTQKKASGSNVEINTCVHTNTHTLGSHPCYAWTDGGHVFRYNFKHRGKKMIARVEI